MPDAAGPTRPKDFEAYWARCMEELDGMPAAPEEEELPLRSTDFCTAYAVRLTSIGPYRIFGYLSIPKGKGPFPALVYLSRLQSVVEIIPQGDANEKRGRFLTFGLAVRGQRNADQPYAAAFPGVYTDGIQDPEAYVFRGIVADCCRAVDYVLGRPEVDRNRVVGIAANDLPVLTAALRAGLTHLVASPGFFHGTMDRAARTASYPLQEVNDYLRMYPGSREAVARTVSYFDPIFFLPKVRASALLWGGPFPSLVEAAGGPVGVRASEHSRYKDGLVQERWIADQFGFESPILPAHWQ